MLKGKWGRRPRTVYAYDVADWRYAARPIRVGYVGKTSSDIRYRDAQHRHDKDWARAIVGPVRIVWSGNCGRASLWLREVYWIHRLRPLFNYEHNQNNPDRIPKWRVHELYGKRPLSYPCR